MDQTNYSITLYKYDGDNKIGEIDIESYGSLEEILDELETQIAKKDWKRYDRWQGDQE